MVPCDCHKRRGGRPSCRVRAAPSGCGDEPAGAATPARPVCNETRPHEALGQRPRAESHARSARGLIGNRSLAPPLARPPFRLLGRLSFPGYLFHFPLLCSLGCGLFVLLRPLLPLGGTLMLVAAVFLRVVVGVGYLFACVDEAWLRWVNRFAVRLTAPEAS